MEMKTETTKSKTTMSKRTMSSNHSPIKSPNRGLVRDLQGAKVGCVGTTLLSRHCAGMRMMGSGPSCIAMAPLGNLHQNRVERPDPALGRPALGKLALGNPALGNPALGNLRVPAAPAEVSPSRLTRQTGKRNQRRGRRRNHQRSKWKLQRPGFFVPRRKHHEKCVSPKICWAEEKTEN